MQTKDFVDLAITENDPERLWQATSLWLGAYGFDKVAYLRTGTERGVIVRTTLGTDFETHYRDQNFGLFDPFLTYCMPSNAPMKTGIDYLDRYDYLSKRERSVVYSASDAGFRSGLSVVTRRDAFGCEAWNLGTSLPREEFEKLHQDVTPELRLGLMVVRGRLAGIGGETLSVREDQCLRLLAEGLRTKAIAHELGIASVTVELHLRNARAKLGALTREHAVASYLARAGHGGELPPPLRQEAN